MNCPSCGAGVPAGETICLDCGTELVFALEGDEPAPSVVADPVPAEPASVARDVSCPDCGEQVAPDANGLCPICGHDFGGVVEIDEDEFFKEPPSLEQAMEAERRRLQGLQTRAAIAGAREGRANPPLPGDLENQSRPTPQQPDPAGPLPLPGDRKRARYKGTGPQPKVSAEAAWLIVDGAQTVFFDGRMTSQIRLDVDQVLIGRRDPAQGHYPDIDLGHFRHIDGHISRRHARVFRKVGLWYLEDLCSNDATYLNDKAHVVNGEAVPLKDGDSVLISDSVSMVFRLQR